MRQAVCHSMMVCGVGAIGGARTATGVAIHALHSPRPRRDKATRLAMTPRPASGRASERVGRDIVATNKPGSSVGDTRGAFTNLYKAQSNGVRPRRARPGGPPYPSAPMLPPGHALPAPASCDRRRPYERARRPPGATRALGLDPTPTLIACVCRCCASGGKDEVC